jgi:16S rRNA C1402 N4-methylase RsmH
MQRRAICPQPEEVRENPRARTAQLRVLEKL